MVGPHIMRRAVGIHPATGLIALVAGIELFGIWGALFAAPLASFLQAVVTPRQATSPQPSDAARLPS